ncbi:hypothetical protein [Nostoc sp. 106C]|nr:hypothetical protein [Nostoc sp. 106C]
MSLPSSKSREENSEGTVGELFLLVKPKYLGAVAPKRGPRRQWLLFSGNP